MNSSESTAPICRVSVPEEKSPRNGAPGGRALPTTRDGTTASGALALQIKQRAHGLGFDLVGITSAQPPRHTEEFRQWLAADFHGEMAYMAKNAEKRINPSAVLSDARSVVVVGMNYYTDDNDKPPHLNPLPRGERKSTARIARYAWGGRDYHEVMLEKLKKLSKVIVEVGGADAKTLSYVDTGPILERDLAQRAGIGFIGKHTNVISRKL